MVNIVRVKSASQYTTGTVGTREPAGAIEAPHATYSTPETPHTTGTVGTREPAGAIEAPHATYSTPETPHVNVKESLPPSKD